VRQAPECESQTLLLVLVNGSVIGKGAEDKGETHAEKSAEPVTAVAPSLDRRALQTAPLCPKNVPHQSPSLQRKHEISYSSKYSETRRSFHAPVTQLRLAILARRDEEIIRVFCNDTRCELGARNVGDAG
jgi:hypothetical protein